MKNFMKKIIVALFVFASLLGSQSVSAANIWNGATNDCPTIAVANFTTNTGYSNPCWNLSSVSASQGDTINVRIYYHNSSDITGSPQTATNVRVILNAPTGGSSTSHTFSAQITSDQGSLSSSTATVNLSGAQTLTFGSTRWYPNQTQSPASFINGQNGSEVIGGGLAIGSVAPGWNTQGSVVVSFRVGTSQTENCTISNFTANGGTTANIQSGNSVNIVWNTNNCTSANVSGPGLSSSSLSGSQTIYPTNSGTYTLTASGSTGGTQTRTVYVNVNENQNNCYINNFTANGSTSTYIQSGDVVRLIWDTNNCTSVNVSGPGIYSTSTNGNQNIYPSNSGTYTLTAYGNTGGTQTRTVYVNVNGNQQNNCYINHFTANGSNTVYVTSGQTVNLSWSTSNCSSATVTGPNGIVISNSLSDFRTIYPYSSGTYTLNAYGYNSGNQTRTVYVNVNTPILPPVYNDCAVTTVATNVTQNSATLNGLLSNSTSASYFEYGTTIGLGQRTTSRTASGSFSEVVTGLSSNTPYFYRFVSQCSGGLSYGKIEVFQTLGSTIIRPVIVQGTTVIGTQSPIMLKIENRYQYIGLGEGIDYTVTYKNIGRSTLTNPVLQVIVPKGITITNTSAGTYSNNTNTLTVPLQDLRAGDEGVVYLQGRVDALPANAAQIVTTAILVYTSPNGAQENAIAYVLNNPKGEINPLGAAAFFGGIFPTTLIGWLLLLVLILLLILLTRRYYSNKSVVSTVTPTGTRTTTTHY